MNNLEKILPEGISSRLEKFSASNLSRDVARLESAGVIPGYDPKRKIDETQKQMKNKLIQFSGTVEIISSGDTNDSQVGCVHGHNPATSKQDCREDFSEEDGFETEQPQRNFSLEGLQKVLNSIKNDPKIEYPF